MDISTKRDTHVHLHCETLQTVCVTDRMVSFTTASGDSLLAASLLAAPWCRRCPQGRHARPYPAEARHRTRAGKSEVNHKLAPEGLRAMVRERCNPKKLNLNFFDSDF